MATTGTAVVSMRLAESGMAGAMACRPSTCALYLHRAPSLSLVASPRQSSAKFISILSSASSRTSLNVLAIHALDPDFYKIPYVEGIPVGKRLKLWNLPPDCKHSELMEWFTGIDVTVDSLEFTNDPTLNAQGIGGFVEFSTKQQACIAIVRLDGYKFRGHCIRMDFAEKRPHPRDYGSRRNSPNRSSSSSSSRGSFATPPPPPVTDMMPSYGGTTSANTQSSPIYEIANTMDVQASTEHQSSMQSGYHSNSGNGERIPSSPTYGNVQPPPAYSSSTGYGATKSFSGHGSAPSSFVSGGTPSNASTAAQSAPRTQSAPGYGSTPGYGVVTSHSFSESRPSNGLTQSPLSHAPSGPGIQPSPSYGTGPVSGGTQPRTIQYNPSDARSYSSHESSQQAPSYNGAESSYSQLDGQSASAPLAPAPSYGNSGMQPVRSDGTAPIRSDGANRSSPAPSYGNSGMPPVRSSGVRSVRSDGTNMGDSGTWASPNYSNKSPQADANYGVNKSQTSYSSQPSSSILNNQSGSAFGKSIPPSYVNSSPQPASPVDKSTPQSSSSYGSIKNNKSGSGYGPVNNNQPDYGNNSLSSYGDRSPPFVDKSKTRSSSSYGSKGSRQPSSYVGNPPPSKSSEAQSSARYSTTQAAPSAYGGTASPSDYGGTAALNDVRAFLPNLNYPGLDLYEDAFKSYGVPDAAEVEPWSKDTNFRSGPMYGSPQPSSLNRLFVGNLVLSIDDATLQELFSRFGTVLEARVLRDQESGRSRGFGVVAMSSVDEMKAASEALDGWQVESRPLKVNAVAFKH